MAYFLSPFGNTQTIDANGDPLVGGTISTFLAGTTTPETTYTDDTGGAPQGVVMTINSKGYPTNGPVWMLGGVPLKFIIKDAAGVTQSTFDDVSGIGDAATAADQWVLYGAAPTYISATSFSVVGDQTNAFHVGRRLKSTNSGGTVYSSITATAFGATVTTVTVVNTSGVLDSGLSAVSYGLLTATNPSVPTIYAKSGANSDITSLTALTAGGLPDNSVLTADIANAQVTAAKLDGAQSGSAPIYGARAWVNFNGEGTVAIRASGNVSSITDNGVGEYVVNLITAMLDADYAVGLGGSVGAAAGFSGQQNVNLDPNFVQTASAFGIRVSNSITGGTADYAYVTAIAIR